MYGKFETAFKPKVLKNWEVPKLNCDRPKKRTGNTKVVSDPRGHLLPSIHRTNNNNFVGTWRLPKKIDRKTANELNGLIGKESNADSVEKSLVDVAVDEDEEKNKENLDNNIQSRPYVPGDLTEEKYQLPSHEDLARPEETQNPNGFPKIREDFTRPSPIPKKDLSQEVQEFVDLNKEMIDAGPPKLSVNAKKEKRLLSPILAAISNFSLAKKLHRENLEHNPLPDCITDNAYKRIQMQRKKQEPGLVLQDKSFATGVGWKGHPGYGPTRCTKMKVYRPKTCGHKDLRDVECISSFDKKWRFIRQSKVTPMDLAICWDLTPEDPKDEPERPTHIDGSNGSAAPAVFSLVHTPKSEEDQTPKCDGIHACGPVFDHGDKGNEDKEYFFHRTKNSRRESRDSEQGSLVRRSKSAANERRVSQGSKDSVDKSNNGIQLNHSRAKSAYDVNAPDRHSVNSKESSLSSKLRAKSAYHLNKPARELNNNKFPHGFNQSTPNLSECDKCSEKTTHQKPIKPLKSKLCVACEMKNISFKEKRPKSEYKMAFKAGVPQKNKAKRYDYPEHWRLATVYQHSYKPIHARKRPLLQTVYK